LILSSDFWKFLGKTQISPGEASPPRPTPDRDGQSDELMWVTSFAKGEMMPAPEYLQSYMESKGQSQDSELCCQIYYSNLSLPKESGPIGVKYT
jgi:hypothetical protein